MTYAEIIECNSRIIHNPWWAKHAFHYTDVENAINILKSGFLFSRVNAENLKVMKNDNASRQVIDMTYSNASSYVRFYFRPLTPTQYHNEGFKHGNLRYCHDQNANVPVPVFFIFDLEKILSMPDTRFSEKTLAGTGCAIHSGPHEFSKLNFGLIYGNGSMNDSEEEKKYRQAEIVYPGKFEVKPFLKAIACRNDVERKTLLNMLRREELGLFNEYKKMILVMDECFEKNGLFISECEYNNDTISIVLSDTTQKRYYTDKHKTNKDKLEVKMHADFAWMKKNVPIAGQGCDLIVDYENSNTITFTGLIRHKEATALFMRIFFEGKLVCYMCWQLADAAML